MLWKQQLSQTVKWLVQISIGKIYTINLTKKIFSRLKQIITEATGMCNGIIIKQITQIVRVVSIA